MAVPHCSHHCYCILIAWYYVESNVILNPDCLRCFMMILTIVQSDISPHCFPDPGPPISVHGWQHSAKDGHGSGRSRLLLLWVQVHQFPSSTRHISLMPQKRGDSRLAPCAAQKLGWAHAKGPGARPTNGISIEFEIRSNFAELWFKTYSTNHNEILHTSRQCNCRDVCKISVCSLTNISN